MSVLAGTLLAFSASPASAVLGLVETSTKTVGNTTIDFDSSFEDLDYTLGDTINLTVTWSVSAGAASFVGFELKGKGYTPISKRNPRKGSDPADGTVPVILSSSDGSVDVSFSFTDLHFSEEEGIEIGNAHFKLILLLDTDNDNSPDTPAGFGVNVHVEDPL